MLGRLSRPSQVCTEAMRASISLVMRKPNPTVLDVDCGRTLDCQVLLASPLALVPDNCPNIH